MSRRHTPGASSSSRRRAQARPQSRGLGGQQVEGRHAVRELLAAKRRRAHELWLADDLDPAPILDEIIELASVARVPVRSVSRSRLEEMAATEAPQGVVARAEPVPEVDLDQLCRPLTTLTSGQPAPFLLALDGVTDPHNVGALLRTACCAGVTGVVLARHRAVHITPTVTKVAAGAVEWLPLALVGGLPSALARMKDLGLWVVGLDPAGDQSLFELPVATEPLMLVVGAEGSGLARLTRQRCDLLVSIPLGGPISSLNVAAAGALACFEVNRRRSQTT